MELERSILAFGLEDRDDPEQLLAMLSYSDHDRGRIIIRDGRLVVDRKFLEDKKKSAHLNVLLSIVAFHQKTLPNTMYLHEAGSTGMSKLGVDDDNKTGLMNVTTVIAKKYGYAQRGILVPNCYYGRNGRVFDKWADVIAAVTKFRDRREWSERNPRVFWRGDFTWNTTNKECERLSGQFARMDALSLMYESQHPNGTDLGDRRHPSESLDLGFGKCVVASETPVCDDMYTFDDVLRSFMAAIQRYPKLVTDKRFYYFDTYTKYQFLFNLPGKTMGSYSRNLNHLWFTGAVILLWDAPFVEFYYPYLHHGEHVVAVNKKTLLSAVDAIRSNDTLRTALIANARDVADPG